MKNYPRQQSAESIKRQEVYPIGLKFTMKRGKQSSRECEIIDHLTTTNAAGEVVKFRYAIAYDFMGQRMVDRDIVKTTIDRALGGF